MLLSVSKALAAEPSEGYIVDPFFCMYIIYAVCVIDLQSYFIVTNLTTTLISMLTTRTLTVNTYPFLFPTTRTAKLTLAGVVDPIAATHWRKQCLTDLLTLAFRLASVTVHDAFGTESAVFPLTWS